MCSRIKSNNDNEIANISINYCRAFLYALLFRVLSTLHSQNEKPEITDTKY